MELQVSEDQNIALQRTERLLSARSLLSPSHIASAIQSNHLLELDPRQLSVAEYPSLDSIAGDTRDSPNTLDARPESTAGGTISHSNQSVPGNPQPSLSGL